MDFTEVVRHRRMVRSYDPERPLPAGLLDRLAGVALRAPSAGFTQGVSLVLLENPAERDTFWRATSDPEADNRWLSGMQSAPGLIIVITSAAAYRDRYALPDKARTDQDPWTAPYWFVDAGMAAMAILYAIVDAGADHPGLGGCFFGVPGDRADELRTALDIPADQELVGVISVGYRAADERPSGSPRRRGRKPREQLVHRGRWSTT